MNTNELKTSYLTWDVYPCGYSINNENREAVLRELALDLVEDVLNDVPVVDAKMALNLADLAAYGMELDKFFAVNFHSGWAMDTTHETTAAGWHHRWLAEDNEQSAIYTIVITTDVSTGAEYAHLARAII